MVSTIPIPMYKGDGDHVGLWDLLYAQIYIRTPAHSGRRIAALRRAVHPSKET